ncbi:unnamed protein product [Lymnaea stagnalis]|uniref:TNFR-Cys domain-containing protein n=1 Tax=Lymnaea stagnalis TaxID=6523 RepID=A0AAV2HI87_LYMST
MNSAIFLVVLITSSARAAENMLLEDCDVGTCGEGERFDVKLRACQPCDRDTYIDISNHSCEDCRNCTRADRYDGEIVVANCTAVADAVIGCHHGYFMVVNHLAEKDLSCEICKRCNAEEVVEQNCTERNDTVCTRRESAGLDVRNRASSNNIPTVIVASAVALVAVVICCVFLIAARRRIKAVCRCVKLPCLKERTERTMRKALMESDSTPELCESAI